MPVIEYPIWDDIGAQLKEKYKKRYVTPEPYLFPNPLEAFVVLPVVEDKFFGAKACNIFIVADPIGWVDNFTDGWEEQWPPPGWNDSVARHKETYSKFTEYNTFVWVDRYIETLIEEAKTHDEDTEFPEMMEATSGRMQDLCNELAEYGWHWMGEIDSAVEQNFFHDTINNFFNIAQD